MRRPIGGAIAPANAALMVEQTVVSVGPRRRFVPTTELANQIADALEDGLALPAPAPTNNPDRLARLCRDLRDLRQDSETPSELPADGNFRMLDKPETDELDRLDRFAGRPTRRRPTRRLTRRRATRFAGQMSFTNNGAAGHNAVIRDVSATIELGDRKIEQYWQSFATVTRQSREFMVEVKETAHPFVVNGSGAVSYMVTFSPRVKDCIEQISTTIGCHRAPTLRTGYARPARTAAEVTRSRERLRARLRERLTQSAGGQTSRRRKF